MSNQLKLFLYIVFVAAIFLFVQDKFNIFNVSLINNDEKQVQVVENTNLDDLNAAVTSKSSSYIEIITGVNKSVKVNVEIADTPIERQNGLSFRKYLGDYDGMLFIFDKEVNNPFWMKDMQIPLDMIFFNSSGFIVDMKESLAPCTKSYCPSIYSTGNYKYVLEVNSGFIEKNNILSDGSFVLYLESEN